MPVLYRCPNPECRVVLKTPLRVRSGKSVACPKCHARFVAEPTTGVSVGTPGLKSDARPDTRAQDSADRARMAVDPIREADPIRLNLEPGSPVPGLSSWVLERQLGLGGFGEVWLSRHEWKRERRAVKFFTHPEARYRLVTHEKKVLVRVMKYAGGHPNIVPLTDVNLEGDMPWLMYEYVAGGTLADWVHTLQGMTAERRQVQILAALKQLVDAVGFFHRLDPPIVHRDLKPANILLNKASKKLQITDFGIGAVTAKATLMAESRGQSTHGGRLLTYMRGSHTPLYASPQQKGGADPDPRDDVHARPVARQVLPHRRHAHRWRHENEQRHCRFSDKQGLRHSWHDAREYHFLGWQAALISVRAEARFLVLVSRNLRPRAKKPFPHSRV